MTIIIIDANVYFFNLKLQKSKLYILIRSIALVDKNISLGEMKNAYFIFKQLQDNLIEWHPLNISYYKEYGK